jgi:hypothetical protein
MFAGALRVIPENAPKPNKKNLREIKEKVSKPV